MASKDFGGRMTVRTSTGALLAMRGSFSITASGQSNEVEVAQDGSADRVGKPTAYRAEVTFKDDGVDFTTVMTAARQNFTIFEEFTNVTHYFFNAFFTGEPVSNRINGEVTGLTIVGESYRRTDG
ncbi:hypothetical protein H4S14_000804 [Agrobacterium vitis]|nr:hypothetical protein [Agrobacterium vitis]MBE1437077.1 hypothetical protein [Agrobacterium vitis]